MTSPIVALNKETNMLLNRLIHIRALLNAERKVIDAMDVSSTVAGYMICASNDVSEVVEQIQERKILCL